MTEKPEQERATQAWTLALLGVIGQVGCLTIVIIAVALIAGLWLDDQFHTRPLFTIIFMVGSVPVTLYLMVRIVLTVAEKYQLTTSTPPTEVQEIEEESEGGKRRDPEEAS
ncbi:MAG: hypothetical protein GTO18_17375 [Anaerolineales bacterium]|nr:hypothetical protein [Anaerolineales bacterium]